MFDGPGLAYGLTLLAIPSLALALRPGVSRSRRMLACALVLFVPVAGVVLALLVRRVRGGGIALEPLAELPAPRLTSDDVTRLGGMPSVLERLLSGDAGERLEALVALSSAGDAEAVAVLRWTIEHGPPEVVLDCALTLEEIDLRGERLLASACEGIGDARDVDRLLAAADAAARPVLSRIADPALAPMLAQQARGWYRQALACAPERLAEIGERIALLELAAGRPAVAHDMLQRMPCEDARLALLRDDAAFAAREFDTLAFAPRPLEVPTDVAARMLQTRLS